MSGTVVSEALQDRFEAVRRSELDRLRRRLAGLTDDDRQSAEAIIADVIGAIARLPERALTGTRHHPRTLQAIVQLFKLETE